LGLGSSVSGSCSKPTNHSVERERKRGGGRETPFSMFTRMHAPGYMCVCVCVQVCMCVCDFLCVYHVCVMCVCDFLCVYHVCVHVYGIHTHVIYVYMFIRI